MLSKFHNTNSLSFSMNNVHRHGNCQTTLLISNMSYLFKFHPQHSLAENMEGDAAPHFDSFNVEKTLALITPAIMELAPQIKEMIIENGFEILAEKIETLSIDQAKQLFTECYNEDYYSEMVEDIADKEILAMCIAKNNCVSEWLSLIGLRESTEGLKTQTIKSSFEEKYAEINSPYEIIHGSKTSESSVREIHFFFPTMITDTLLINGKRIEEYLMGNSNPILLEGLREVCKKQPEDPIVWLADWLLTHNNSKEDE